LKLYCEERSTTAVLIQYLLFNWNLHRNQHQTFPAANHGRTK